MPAKVNTTDPVPIHPAAAESLKRQKEFLLQVVSGMAKAEEKRVERVSKTRNPKDRRDLEKRYANERKVETDRIMRLKEETKQMAVLAEKGSYNGTIRNSNMKAQPIGNVEVSGLESRGGLTDSQYKFLKQAYDKMEAPIKPPRNPNAPCPPKISYFRDKKNHARMRQLDSERRGLLGEKKYLLTNLAGVVSQQDALMRHGEWAQSSSRSMSTSRSNLSTGGWTARNGGGTARSGWSTARSNASVASMASFKGRHPEHTFTKPVTRPKNVPRLF
ncbi:hypothetical protein TrRE_jg8406 [Triparma retinervis]|uniref:Uncharacterized protein n=1 Tax=Triparma retinervis TaxID=2557542 RepID=A0A9W7DLF6_9STRA|nr:hypothetical protein TrRE_jg8406 [Triparma retinervis]